VQERLFTSQEQFQAHPDWLQWYVLSSMMLFGALYFEINTGTDLSSSSFKPLPSGGGSMAQNGTAWQSMDTQKAWHSMDKVACFQTYV